MAVYWGEKRYHSLDYHLKNTYGSKLYKLSLNGGMTCPNRDGTCGTRGCIFCSQGGSGDFAESPSETIREQIEHGKIQSRRQIWRRFLYCILSSIYEHLCICRLPL